MYRLYEIVNNISGSVYVGITGASLARRWSSHIYRLRTGKKTKLYDAIRSYGLDKFEMSEKATFNSREECEYAEICLISYYKSLGKNIYNMTKGGDGGWCVQDIESWKNKMKQGRRGRKPALGMKHTEENKKLFADVSRKYWDSQDTYNPEDVIKYTHKEAKRVLGISTTHYYRLRKQYLEGINSSDNNPNSTY